MREPVQIKLPSAISTVLLDADGVVQTTAPGWLDALGSLCGRAESADAFLEEVFAMERPALIGAGSFRLALAELLARWESAATVDEAIRIWHLIEPQTEVLAQAQVLRQQGIRVSLATNQQAERAAYMSHSLGYADQFDDLFFSCELGHAKPDAAYFGAVLERLQQPAAEVLFVDDNELNVAAALDAGLQARIFDLRDGPERMTTLLAEFGLNDG